MLKTTDHHLPTTNYQLPTTNYQLPTTTHHLPTTQPMNKTTLTFYWGARIIAAIILLQTLFFKFSASPESVYIFTAVGMEPWGRIGVGVLELIAGVLILISSTA